MTREERAITAQLVAGRILVGGGTLVAPRLLGRAFGIDPAANPAVSYVGRLFGVRAVLMAVQLATVPRAQRRRLVGLHVAVDAVDAAAAVAATRSGALSRRAGAMATAAAVVEGALGVALLGLDARGDADARAG